MLVTPRPKPAPRKTLKGRATRQYQQARRACIDAVCARDGFRCKKCGMLVKHYRNPEATPYDVAHVHEVIPRSLGGDATDPNGCMLLCPRCHRQIHGLGRG